MDQNQIAFELGKLGLLPEALQDGLHRAEAHFRDHDYSPEAATAWAAQQRLSAAHLFGGPPTPPAVEPPVWAQLGMSEEAFARMPPDWRMTEARRLQPPPVYSRRPVSRSLTAAELATLEGVPWAERREKARQLQQTPAPPAQP